MFVSKLELGTGDVRGLSFAGERLGGELLSKETGSLLPSFLALNPTVGDVSEVFSLVSSTKVVDLQSVLRSLFTLVSVTDPPSGFECPNTSCFGSVFPSDDDKLDSEKVGEARPGRLEFCQSLLAFAVLLMALCVLLPMESDDGLFDKLNPNFCGGLLRDFSVLAYISDRILDWENSNVCVTVGLGVAPSLVASVVTLVSRMVKDKKR